jgi:phage terminase small subunit
MALSTLTIKDDDPRLSGLTVKQRAFVRNFLSEGDCYGNATTSALKAGYKQPEKGSLNAHQTLNHPNVQRAMAAIMAEQLAAPDGMALKSALARIARSDMSNFLSVTEDGRFEIDAIKARDAAAIGQIKEYRDTEHGVVIKLHDPRPAIETLAKILGLLKDRVEHSGEVRFNPITLDGDKEVTADSRFN